MKNVNLTKLGLFVVLFISFLGCGNLKVVSQGEYHQYHYFDFPEKFKEEKLKGLQQYVGKDSAYILKNFGRPQSIRKNVVFEREAKNYDEEWAYRSSEKVTAFDSYEYFILFYFVNKTVKDVDVL